MTILSVLFEGYFRYFINSIGISTFYQDNNYYLENILSEDFLNNKVGDKIPKKLLNDIIYVLVGNEDKTNETLSLRHKIWHGALSNEHFNIDNCIKVLNLYRDVSILYNIKNKDLD